MATDEFTQAAEAAAVVPYVRVTVESLGPEGEVVQRATFHRVQGKVTLTPPPEPERLLFGPRARVVLPQRWVGLAVVGKAVGDDNDPAVPLYTIEQVTEGKPIPAEVDR